MKNYSILLTTFILASILASWSHKVMVDKDIKMYSQVWDDVINKGEIDKINAKYFDENVTGISSPENIVGIEAFKAYYQHFLTGFSDREFTIKNIFGQNENIVKHWHFTGKHTGDFFGIPATGKTITIEGATLIVMKDGKILQEQDFMDNMVFMQQLGLAPNPENAALVNQLYAHFSEGNIDAVLAMMDDNILWNESTCSSYSDGNPYTSPEAVLNGVFGRIGQDNESFILENIKLAGLGENKVLASLNYKGKSKKTGETYTTLVVHEWSVENQKITGFQQYIGLGQQ